MENNKREWPPVRRPRRRGVNVRPIALALALVLLVGAAVGGTIAWLIDKTAPVTNTFTTAGIDIDLTETFNTASKEGGQMDTWTAQMIPGKEYKKDPVVAVDGTKTDIDVYLFVKFEEKNNASTYLTYTSLLNEANGWDLVDGQTNVWWREVKTTDGIKSWHLLEGDKVTVKNTVTKNNMTDAANAELVYTAYAIQKEGFATAELAWAEASK